MARGKTTRTKGTRCLIETRWIFFSIAHRRCLGQSPQKGETGTEKQEEKKQEEKKEKVKKLALKIDCGGQRLHRQKRNGKSDKIYSRAGGYTYRNFSIIPIHIWY